ncbi:hypothetical protein ACH4TX_12525 [Streptomyces sp. NPDC021098]|uniref:hypothetical protein n=1 Tax=unclassified Streptomyces TaxID=2593676 RepID=UPI0037B89E78
MADDDRADRDGPDDGGADDGGADDASPWARFTHSPFLPATVIVLIISAGAGLFAGSYTFAFANPTPRQIPVAVVRTHHGTAPPPRFVAGMEKALNASLRLHPEPGDGRARWAVEEQQAFGILRMRVRRVGLGLSSAAGASVAQVLASAGTKVGRAVGVPVAVTDLKPLQPGDPRGLAVFCLVSFEGAHTFRRGRDRIPRSRARNGISPLGEKSPTRSSELRVVRCENQARTSR